MFKVESEKERRFILWLGEHSAWHSWGELSRSTGISIEGLKKIVSRLSKQGIIEWSGNREAKLIRDKVRIERFSWKIFRSQFVPIATCLAFALAIGIASMQFIFILGALVVAIPLIVYSFYSIWASEKLTNVYKSPLPVDTPANTTF